MSLLVSIVAVVLSLSSTIVAGGECPGVHRKMTMEEACREKAMTMKQYQFCIATLRHYYRAGTINEAGMYAYDAASKAPSQYSGTRSWMTYLLERNQSSFPGGGGGGEEKAAYELCVRGYQEAQAAMTWVWRKVLVDCSLGDNYRAVLRDVAACRDRVAKLSPPAKGELDMVEKDHSLTLVAYMLGKLIGIK